MDRMHRSNPQVTGSNPVGGASVMKKTYEHYIHQDWAGRRLLEKHKLSEEGYWKVLGADSNPDFGGNHHQPFLGIYKGRLSDVIRAAILINRFWSWGGGTIEKVTIIDVDEMPKTEEEKVRHDALNKLTHEEREALGLE